MITKNLKILHQIVTLIKVIKKIRIFKNLKQLKIHKKADFIT